MTITQLTNVPSTSDPANFDTNADNLFGVQLPRLIDEMNVATLAMSLNATNDTSSTSNTIATSGDFTFTVSAGKSFLPGMSLVAADTAAPTTNGMFGQVKSYSGTTLVFTATSKYGSGTKSAWTISQSMPTSSYRDRTTFSDQVTFAVGSSIASASTINLATATGNTAHITGTTPVAAVTMNAGQWIQAIFDGACPLTYHATNHKLNTNGQSVTLTAGDSVYYYYDGTTVYGFIMKQDGTATIARNVKVRQTVLSGPVDSNGLASFGGSTGSTTVTASGTLIATAANGFDSNGEVNRIGSITNPSWTGLSTNGTMYLYGDINADGTITPVAVTLPPTYQAGGTYGTTNGQFTFNYNEYVGKVGNGSVATQTYRVCFGEVTVAGGVVTAITWYQLNGHYDSGYTATLLGASTTISKNSNLGVYPDDIKLIIECTSADNGYSIGDRLHIFSTGTVAAAFNAVPVWATKNTVGYSTAGTNGAVSVPKGGGAPVNLTLASWKYKLIANRGW